MLDALSLDQMRVFVTIVDTGSFSAAARELRRAQSAVSHAVVNLENALGVALFDRTGWKPTLTAHGQALLADARSVLYRTEQFKARALSLTRGIEAELSIVFDVMYPVTQLVDLVARLRDTFPGLVIRLRTEVLGGVPSKVLSGECDLGVQGSLPGIDEGLVSHLLPEITLIPVAAPAYPLTEHHDISEEELKQYTQIVLTDNSGRTSNQHFSVYSAHRILTADLGSKHAMLRAGLGWGFMPKNVVEEDVASGKLIQLDLHNIHTRARSLPLYLIYAQARPPGPAGQWIIDQLVQAKRP